VLRVSIHAYIDESGQLSHSRLSSDHFVMSAVACRHQRLENLDRLLARMRNELGRGENDRLTWKKLKKSEHREKASEMLGRASFIQVVSVVVCKRHLRPLIKDKDAAYLETFRYLLERLSWLGYRWGTQVHYTLSHIKSFEVEKLSEYEATLRSYGTGTQIKWGHLDPLGGRISNDNHVPRLQLADIAASATAKAFETHRGRPPDQAFLMNLLPALFRGESPQARNVLTSYGLKMHPWGNRPDVQELYPWIGALR
jgi:hypothetical protein